jgi:uncharacterized membrane protein
MTPRRWAIVLFCSLAVNVLLAGFVASAYIKRDRDMASRMTVYTVPWAFRVIGDEVGALARRNYLKYQAVMTKERQELMRDYEMVNAALSAPQFERKKFAEALDRLRVTTVAAQTTMHEAMTEFAAELTPEQRRELAMRVNEWTAQRERRALRREQEIEKRERRDAGK